MFFVLEIHLLISFVKSIKLMITLKNAGSPLFDSPMLSDNLLHALLHDAFQPVAPKHIPLVNVYESETAYELMMALPGYDKSSVHVDYHEHILTVSAEQQNSHETTANKTIRKELHLEAFKRQFKFEGVQAQAIVAKFDNGLLKITLPKQMPQVVNKINVL